MSQVNSYIMCHKNNQKNKNNFGTYKPRCSIEKLKYLILRAICLNVLDQGHVRVQHHENLCKEISNEIKIPFFKKKSLNCLTLSS